MQSEDIQNKAIASSFLESAANHPTTPNPLQQQAINLMRGLTRERNNSADLENNHFWTSDYEDPSEIMTSLREEDASQEDNEYIIPGEFEGQIFIPDLSVFFKEDGE